MLAAVGRISRLQHTLVIDTMGVKIERPVAMVDPRRPLASAAIAVVGFSWHVIIAG
jgi:hypothetical protein